MIVNRNASAATFLRATSLSYRPTLVATLSAAGLNYLGRSAVYENAPRCSRKICSDMKKSRTTHCVTSGSHRIEVARHREHRRKNGRLGAEPDTAIYLEPLGGHPAAPFSCSCGDDSLLGRITEIQPYMSGDAGGGTGRIDTPPGIAAPWLSLAQLNERDMPSGLLVWSSHRH